MDQRIQGAAAESDCDNDQEPIGNYDAWASLVYVGKSSPNSGHEIWLRFWNFSPGLVRVSRIPLQANAGPLKISAPIPQEENRKRKSRILPEQ